MWGMRMQCMWRSEDTFVESVLPFYFFMGLGIKLRFPDFYGKPLYILSHLSGLEILVIFL